MPNQALCIISSPYVTSNWSYSPETTKLGFYLCELDLWPLMIEDLHEASSWWSEYFMLCSIFSVNLKLISWNLYYYNLALVELSQNYCSSYLFNLHAFLQCYLQLIGAKWRHIVAGIWVNIGLDNGLLPDGTKPLPEPMLTDHQWSPVTFILGQFQRKCLNHQSLKSVWKLKM